MQIQTMSRTPDPRRSSRELYRTAFGAGVLGAAALTVIGWLIRVVGLSTLHPELILGSLITGSTGFGTVILGFAWHLLNGGIFALIYASSFRSLRMSRTKSGTSLGAIHWVAAGIALGVVRLMHPLMPAVLMPPGYFAFNHNFFTVVSVLALHLIYGAIVGSICDRAIRERRVIGIEDEAIETRRAA